MKYLLFLLFIPTAVLSQTQEEIQKFLSSKKDKIYYEGGIMTQETIQNFLGNDERVIQNKVIGKEVQVIIDTIFKKYFVFYTGGNGENMVMAFDYIRYYYPDKKGNYIQKNNRDKLYLMEFQGLKFFLIDYLDFFPIRELIISDEELLPNSCTLVFRIKNAERTIK